MHRPVDLISLSRVCVISAVTLVLACFTWSTQADAHEFPYCSGAGIRQPGSFVGFSINPGWGPTTQTAIRDSANAINNATDFFWQDQAGYPAWLDAANPDTALAGLAAITYNCGTENISNVDLYLNFPHFSAAPHTRSEIACTAIHEFGHAMGFDHNTVNFSMMNPSHPDRCHDGSPISTPFSHDVLDVNAKY